MNKNTRWIINITLVAFIITILFSLGSQFVLKDVHIITSIFVILLFIFIGVLFDIIGVAVQSSEKSVFHAMASKKVRHAKTAKHMLENSAKVSSFCNDVIGDICNIISGSAGIVVANSISLRFNLNTTIITLIITSLIAALTIGGKAIGKNIAVKKSEYIVNKTTKFIEKFKRK